MQRRLQRTHNEFGKVKQCHCDRVKVLLAQLCLTLCEPHGLWPLRLICPQNSPGRNTGVGFSSLLQGIFLTRGSNLGLLLCRQILYHLSHQGGHCSNRRLRGECMCGGRACFCRDKQVERSGSVSSVCRLLMSW